MRKYYIDNLRIFCILLLFPYHTAMIFNAWGEQFYIHGNSLSCLTLPMSLIYPWWMNLLFTIAGISAAYSLKKRSLREFAKERFKKLLIPFLTGILLIIPVQSYIADVFHNNYSGGYFEHYKTFFIRFTDLTGYDGGFTPGHMWFMLYLFIISMLMLPIISFFNRRKLKISGTKIKLIHILPLFLVILLITPILEISGKSVGEAFACFLLGFFLISIDEIQDLLEKNCLLISSLFVMILCVHSLLIINGMQSGILWDIEYRIFVWFGILAFLSLGKRFLNKTNKLLKYLSQAAFPLYFFHQSILVIIGYFILKLNVNVLIQFLLIMTLSFIGSILCYEIFRRFKVTRFLFGIKTKHTEH